MNRTDSGNRPIHWHPFFTFIVVFGALVAAMFLWGCTSAPPPEAFEAVEVSQKAAEAIEADYRDRVRVDAANMERMGTVILNHEINERMRTETRKSEGNLTPEQAFAIVEFARQSQKDIVEAKGRLLDKARSSENLDIITRMNKALSRYMRGDANAKAEVDRLIGESSVLLKQKLETP